MAHTEVHSDGSNNLLAIVLIIIAVFAFIFWGLPAMRGTAPATPTPVETQPRAPEGDAIPSEIDINIQGPDTTAPTEE